VPFVVGVVIGVGGFMALSPPPTQQLPALGPGMRKVPEPAAAANLMGLIATDNARSLADLLTEDELTALGDALAPLVEIREIRFIDALTIDGDADQVASYVVSGRNDMAQDVVAGLSLRVRDDKVIGVN
jgi:hypothetical protein